MAVPQLKVPPCDALSVHKPFIPAHESSLSLIEATLRVIAQQREKPPMTIADLARPSKDARGRIDVEAGRLALLCQIQRLLLFRLEV